MASATRAAVTQVAMVYAQMDLSRDVTRDSLNPGDVKLMAKEYLALLHEKQEFHEAGAGEFVPVPAYPNEYEVRFTALEYASRAPVPPDDVLKAARMYIDFLGNG